MSAHRKVRDAFDTWWLAYPLGLRDINALDVQEAFEAGAALSGEAAAVPDGLCKQLQKKCVEMDVYWRAPDAHGVDLTIDQATDLLCDALGVEVNIAAASEPNHQQEATALDGWKIETEDRGDYINCTITSPSGASTGFFGQEGSSTWEVLRCFVKDLQEPATRSDALSKAIAVLTRDSERLGMYQRFTRVPE